MNIPYTITNSAFCQARLKLKHTAFIELNDCVLHEYYAADTFKTHKGYRLIGVDASKVILPNTKSVRDEFGTTKIVTTGESDSSEYASMLFECGYDVLNHMCLYASLHPGNTYEVTAIKSILTASHYMCNRLTDLFIFDRGYASFEMFAYMSAQELQYVIRVCEHTFLDVQAMFDGDGPDSQHITLKKSASNKRYKDMNLPDEITLRFVRVVLDTGEIEILATSLNEELFSAAEFKKLYFMRWGTETFFLQVKERLSLENFTGKTAESVKQDFWATIYLSNYESILTEDVDDLLSQKKVKNAQTVNSCISYNAIKNAAFELLMYEDPIDDVLEKLTKLFLMNPVQIRPGRSSKRGKISPYKSLNYQKRRKKSVF
jgi:hypothetical protein